MNTKKLFYSLILLTIATSVPARGERTPLNLSQDSAGNYLIQSVDDWNNLAICVDEGSDFAGKVFKMTADLGTTANPVVRPIGRQMTSQKSSRMRFAGTFDGNGHTLTVNINSTNAENSTSKEYYSANKAYASPFAYLKGATIENLHVVGTVVAGGQFGSGLVGSTGNNASDGACTIRNCQVSVTLISYYKTTGSTNANHGGLIGVAEGNATISNSWFDGKFMLYDESYDFKCSGGFIGLNKGASTLDNCLFAMTESNFTQASQYDHSYQFANNNSGGKIEVGSTCYYSAAFGTEQGQRVDNLETSLTLHSAQLNGVTRYFTTFYHPLLNFRLSEGAEAVTMAESGQLYLLGDGSIIPSDCPVIIFSFTPTVLLTLAPDTQISTSNNALQGTSAEIDTPSTHTYIVGQVNDSIGLIHYEGEKIPAGKAYYVETPIYQ
jgi:hypothetical protein